MLLIVNFVYYYKVGACIVSPMKKIVAVGHNRKLYEAVDDTVSASGSTDQNDLERGMKNEGLDFSKYI
jgi:deoxycytidylate deaminase